MNVNNNPLGPFSHFPTPWAIITTGSVERIVDANSKLVTNSIRHAADVVKYVNQHAELIEALKLLTYGAERAQIMLAAKALAQPQVNGGLVLAKAALKRAGIEVP